MLLTEINEILQDANGRFKHRSLLEIANRADCSAVTVSNILKRRNVKIATKTKMRVLLVAEECALELVKLEKQAHEMEG